MAKKKPNLKDELYKEFLKVSGVNKKQKSKTQTQIENKIKYQQAKLRKVKSELKEYKELDWRVKVNYEGKKRKVKTVVNDVLNKGTKINTEIYNLKKKLSKFKKPKPIVKINKLDYVQVMGKAWESKDIENSVFKNPEISHVNGIKITQDSDEILDVLNDLKLKMSSKDSLVLIYGSNGRAKLIILNDDDIETLEND